MNITIQSKAITIKGQLEITASVSNTAKAVIIVATAIAGLIFTVSYMNSHDNVQQQSEFVHAF